MLFLGLTALFALCVVVGALGRSERFTPPTRQRTDNSRQYWD